ncbi:MAG: replication initiation protein RepM [Synergistaceae bacterium]
MNRENRLVVKANSLIDASFNLSLVEQRLMLLAITEARELQNLSPETPIEVRAVTYREQYNVDRSESYKQLAEASKQLFNRQFSYIDKYKNDAAVSVSRWVNEVTYVTDKGMVVLYLNRNVISMISRLEEQFTKYHLMQISDLSSQYSVRLYELMAKYINVGNSRKYPIEEIRGLFGIGINEYKSMSDFKKRVLDLAVNELNEKTDITVKYEQFKAGRVITHLLFKITKKREKTSPHKDTVIDLTDKQVLMFSDKLSKDVAFQSHFNADIGESAQDYAEKIAGKLVDPFYVNAWMPFLRSVGYLQSTKKSS